MPNYFNSQTVITAFFSTRKGLEKFIIKELEELNSFRFKCSPILSGPTPTLAHFRLRKHKENNLIKIELLPGGVEIHCTWEFFGIALISIRSTESVWLRIGRPFRCHSSTDLQERIKNLPWNYFIPTYWIPNINIRSISNLSSLWNNNVIKSSVKQAFTTISDIPFISGHCLSIVLHRNTCYVSLQCSGRLSPRHFSFYNYVYSPQFETKTVPYWSLNETIKSVRNKFEGIPYSYNYAYTLPFFSNKRKDSSNDNLDITKENLSHWENNRSKYVDSTKLYSDDSTDYNDIITACVTSKLNLNLLVKDPEPLIIWVPFCGNGNLVFEIASYILKLPVINNSLKGLPITDFSCFSNDWFHNSWDHFSIRRKHISKFIKTTKIVIIGTDFREYLLKQANNKIFDFYNYYNLFFKGQPIISKTDNIHSNHSSLESDLGITVDISFHNAKFQQIIPFIKGALVVIKIPHNNFNKHLKIDNSILLLYEKLGNIISSRSDWKGVYALSRGRLFEHFTRLEWITLFESSNSKGNIIRFQRWSGRKKSLFKYTTKSERDISLNQIDIF